MTDKNDGEPAFPGAYWDTAGSMDFCQGMSLRDWFAGLAMQGYLSNYRTSEINKGQERIAAEAFTMADAMLGERDK